MSAADPAVTAAPPVPVWTCAFETLEGGPLPQDLTVGAKFQLRCHGDIAAGPWDSKVLPKITFKEEQETFALVALKNEQMDPQDVRLVVTGYKAGKHAPEYMRVLQGEKGFEVAKPQWEIKSVLQPNQQPPPQPYGPYGPFRLSLPLWLWAALLLTMVLVVYAIVRQVRRIRQRRRMLEELKRHRTAMTPVNQFYRDARNLRRRIHAAQGDADRKLIVADLNREFRLYVLRQFEIPTLEWSDVAILRDLRKRHRKVYDEAAEPLKRTLRELALVQAREQLAIADVEQLYRMSLDAAERLDSARAGGAK